VQTTYPQLLRTTFQLLDLIPGFPQAWSPWTNSSRYHGDTASQREAGDGKTADAQPIPD